VRWSNAWLNWKRSRRIARPQRVNPEGDWETRSQKSQSEKGKGVPEIAPEQVKKLISKQPISFVEGVTDLNTYRQVEAFEEIPFGWHPAF
jgi:hypothetical protein